jgi:hypothetical protein
MGWFLALVTIWWIALNSLLSAWTRDIPDGDRVSGAFQGRHSCSFSTGWPFHAVIRLRRPSLM